MKDQDDGSDGHSFDSDENDYEFAEKGAWDFRYLKGSGRRGTSMLQAIRHLSTKHKVKELSNLVGSKTIIENSTSFIHRVVELRD